MLNLFRQILAIGDTSVDQAMAAALPTADSTTRRLMALGLLQRRDPTSLVSLIIYFHQLPADVQRTIIRHLDDIPAALRHASRRRGTQGPANALTIIERARATSMCYLITEQLRHGDEPLRAQAGQTLLVLARDGTTLADPRYFPGMTARDAQRLAGAVVEAMKSYPAHERSDVLVALAALLPRAIPEAVSLLSQPSHATVTPMRGLIGQADRQPLLRRVLLLLLPVKPLRDAVITALRLCVRDDKCAQTLANHHLLLLPNVRQSLAHVREPASLCPNISSLELMAGCESRGLVPWLDVLPLNVDDRLARLSDLSQAADPAIRLAALRRIIQTARSPIAPADVLDHVAAFTRDEDVCIARIALWELIRKRYHELMPILGQVLNSRHEALRKIASRHLSPLGFARLWDSWSTMSQSRRLAAGRALIKIDPQFHRQLGLKLARPDQRDRLRALAIIRELNQGAFFEHDLSQLLHHHDEKVASAAARALGSVDSDSAIDSLEQALDHHDSRVRANAVEALSQAKSTKHVKRLISMTESEDNRPRANAIGALMQMRTDQAVQALKQMLADHRAAHRVSALWLVNELGLLEMARQVAEMSISDEDQKVKRQATEVTRELLQIMTDSQTPLTDAETTSAREAAS